MRKELKKFLFISIVIGMVFTTLGFFSTIQFGIYGVFGTFTFGVITLIFWALYVKWKVNRIQS